MAETVSRLMLWVVSAADFSDRTLTPPPHHHLALLAQHVALWVSKAATQTALKALLNPKKGETSIPRCLF